MHGSILDFTLKGNCFGKKKSSLPLGGILFYTTSDTQQVSKLLSFGFFLVVLSNLFSSNLVQELFWFCFLRFLIPCVFFSWSFTCCKIRLDIFSCCFCMQDLGRLHRSMCVIHDHLGFVKSKIIVVH